MAASSFLTVQARLARAMLDLAKHVGRDDGEGRIVIRHKISQSHLAAIAGVARENVSRVMSDWKRNTTRGVGRRLTSRGRHPNKIGRRIDRQAVGASTATRICVLRPRIISSIWLSCNLNISSRQARKTDSLVRYARCYPSTCDARQCCFEYPCHSFRSSYKDIQL